MRRRTATPPGRLRLLSIIVTVGLLVLWVAAFTTVRARQQALHSLRTDSGPSLIAAQSLHADLSAADAAAARAFLAGGVEPPDQRAAYQRAIADASERIVDLARAGGPREPLTVLTERLPVYTGEVERARANNRLGLVVGGAYQRAASSLMQGTILPAADRLAAAAADRIDRDYRQASRAYHPVVVAVAGLATLAVLIALQIRLFRRTNRILNPALVAATLLATIALGWTIAAFGVQRARLLDSRDDGYVPMTMTAQARVLALRAWGDESLSLISRGNGADLDADADAVSARLGYDPQARPTRTGLLATTAALPGPDRPARDALAPAWQAYQASAARVRALVAEVGGFQQAVALAQGGGTDAFRRFDTASTVVFDASRGRFEQRLAAADDALDTLPLAVTAALLFAAALALVGIQLRINDYR
ncbi:hypothetical protein UK82_27300 [Frankia sp. ACN1ag]|nr:hypothetical protein UK82_27300 [Frankia sp. ACN1ag]